MNTWPKDKTEADATQLIAALDDILTIIQFMRPGEWCDLECSEALHRVAAMVRVAKEVVYRKSGLARAPIT